MAKAFGQAFVDYVWFPVLVPTLNVVDGVLLEKFRQNRCRLAHLLLVRVISYDDLSASEEDFSSLPEQIPGEIKEKLLISFSNRESVVL